ncbi:MAG: tetratricopeptide repeat protein [Candidatus Omnitrophota bacterium]
MRLGLKIFAIALTLLITISGVSFAWDKEEENFSIAAKAFSDNFYGASLSLFEKFIRDYPQSPLRGKAKLYIAKCYFQKEDYSRALSALTEFDNKKEDKNLLDEAYHLLGLIHFEANDFFKSQSYIQKVIDNYPNSEFKWRAYLLSARNNLELGRAEQAQNLFEKIINESRQAEIIEDAYLRLLDIYLQKKKYALILSLGAKYIKNFPKGKFKARAYFYLGEAGAAQGELNKALDNYQQALKLGCEDSLKDLIYQSMGFNYLNGKDRVNAKANIDKIKDKHLRLFSQGIYYFKVKDYIQALEVFNIFIRDYSKSPLLADAYLSKADLLYEMGRLNDSISIYMDILSNFEAKQFPDIVNKAHYGIAWCRLKNGKFKEAISEFKSTLEHAYDPIVKVSSQIQIADAYQETAKYDQALDIYSKILEDYPNTIYADYIQFQIGMSFLKKKDLEKALLALKNLKNNFSSSKLVPQAQYYLAVGYFSAGDYAEAKRLLENFIDKFAQDELITKVYYLYAKCFFNSHNYEQALAVFEEIIRKYKDKDIEELVYIDIANTYLNLELFDKAKRVWEDFLGKFPQSRHGGLAALGLGGLYEKEENYIEAEKYYKKVILGYKDSALIQEAELSLGHLYWSKNDLFKAKEYFKKLIEKEASLSPKAKFYLAKILAQEGKSKDALELYDQLVESSSLISKAALLEKGFLFKETKNYLQAIKAFEAAIEAGIDTVEARFSVGLCREKSGQDKEAIEEYLKAIYKFSNQEQLSEDLKNYQIKAYFRIAKIYEKSNDIESAKEVYKKIIDLDTQEAKIAEVRLGELEKK